jgi:hypothetical protein
MPLSFVKTFENKRKSLGYYEANLRSLLFQLFLLTEDIDKDMILIKRIKLGDKIRDQYLKSCNASD